MSTHSDAFAAAPRELVLASAGTGKTYRIAQRLIGLLAGGAPAESLFASTFTRKAAGEILERVMTRLAEASLRPEAAAKLAEDLELPAGSAAARPEAWQQLLRAFAHDLHRVNIGTLDAFFVRAAGSFGDELALPAAWVISDPPGEARVRARALDAVLAGADREVLLEMVRGVEGDAVVRSVHQRLAELVGDLLFAFHGVDPQAAGVWEGLPELAAQVPADLDAEVDALARGIVAIPPVMTAKGTIHLGFRNAVEGVAAALAGRDWNALLKSTLFSNASAAEPTYGRLAIPAPLLEALGEARVLARHALARRITRQSRSLGELGRRLARELETAQRDSGSYGFSDLPRLLGGANRIGGREDLAYRLDGRMQHVLLDEFQDTSLQQWEALAPLLDGQAGAGGANATVVVADPKQSIYAWRGGEPQLVHHVGERYRLREELLTLSWRSSRVVLDLVNRVFEGLGQNRVFEGRPVEAATASSWAQDFKSHQPKKDLPGYVSLEVGPDDESKSNRKQFWKHTALRVKALRDAAPGLSIGVLTRTNGAVARIMLELRELGVDASEEGGNPLTDSALVSALLALLRLADHPGDSIAEYHVRHTPLGAVVRLGEHAPARVAEELRRELARDGYGRTLERLCDAVAGECDARELRRAEQLVEMAYAWEPRATLRSSDFIALVEAQRVEDPSSTDVRVMTIHQSKGLEFDAVVLPELDGTLSRADFKPFVYRPAVSAGITRVFPYVAKKALPLFSDQAELQSAANAALGGRLRDSLSALYVGLTRARYAVVMLIPPDGSRGEGDGCTNSRLIRNALSDSPETAVPGATLYQQGDSEWADRVLAAREAERAPATGEAPVSTEAAEAPIRSPGVPARVTLARPESRSRGLLRRTPSQLAGGTRLDVRTLVSLEPGGAERGTLAHAWLEQLRWIEDGLPEAERLRAVARRLGTRLGDAEVGGLMRELRESLENPAIHRALSQASYPSGAVVEREVPFLHREGEVLMDGKIDRLVRFTAADGLPSAEILDYKTDSCAPGDRAALAQKQEHYRPQMDAYARAVAAGLGLPRERVRVRLIMLSAGEVVDV